MRQFNKFRGTKGFLSTWSRVVRFRDMISDKAHHRARVLSFWSKYGIEAACEYAERKQSTLYRWRAELRKRQGRLEALNDKRTNKKIKRKRIVDPRIEEYIIKTRIKHYRYGKEKLQKDLEELCSQWEIKTPSVSTVGRIIKDLKNKNRLPEVVRYSLNGKTGRLNERKPRKKAKKQRRKGYQPKKSGDLIEIDTVVYFINGIRRYIITAIDLESDFAFSFAYSHLSSSSGKDFVTKLEKACPFKIKRVQTDNGQEFAKYFASYLKERNITHFHTYPRSPKMNAHIERFNRTIKEEFSNWQRNTLAYDINRFNREMMDWLLWYNTERRHHSLGLVSPMSYIMSTLQVENSQVGWTNLRNR